MSKNNEIDDKMLKFRMNLAIEHPFWATILFSVNLVPERNMPAIAATDCFKTIYYNPDRFESLNHYQIGFVFIHELLHIVYKHALRQMGRTAKRWNKAGDYMINLTLKDMGKWVEPFPVLCDEKYRGMSSEEIYEKLPVEQEGKGKGEFYTPKCIVNLLAEMIEPYSGTIYDPCCGSGGMFVQSIKFIENHHGNKKYLSIFLWLSITKYF